MNIKTLVTGLALAASIITIVVFLTGRNFPDILEALKGLRSQQPTPVMPTEGSGDGSGPESFSGNARAESGIEEPGSKQVDDLVRPTSQPKLVPMGSAGGNLPSIEYLYKIKGGNYDEVVISPDGTRLAAASGWKSPIIILDSDTHDVINRLPSTSNWVHGVVFHPSAGTIATAHSNRRVKIWSSQGRLLEVVETRSPAYSVAFDPTGNILAIGGSRTAWFWEINKRRIAATFRTLASSVRSVEFSPDGRYFAASDAPTALWELSDGVLPPEKPMRSIGPRCHPSGGLTFSADSEFLAGACSGGLIWVSRVSSGELVQSFRLGNGPSVGAVRFGPHGPYLASAANDRFDLRDIRSTASVVTLLEDRSGSFWSLSFSGDGQRLAVATTDYKTNVAEIDLWRLSYPPG